MATAAHAEKDDAPVIFTDVVSIGAPWGVQTDDGGDVEGEEGAERGGEPERREIPEGAQRVDDEGGDDDEHENLILLPGRRAGVRGGQEEGGDAMKLLADDEEVAHGGAEGVQHDHHGARGFPSRAERAAEHVAVGGGFGGGSERAKKRGRVHRDERETYEKKHAEGEPELAHDVRKGQLPRAQNRHDHVREGCWQGRGGRDGRGQIPRPPRPPREKGAVP